MATYYFADNASPNAHANAIQGSDSYNGLHPTWTGGNNGPKRNPANFNFDVLNAGDSVLFARGGYWTGEAVYIFLENPASSSMARTNMIRFGEYDPGTGVTGKPWLNASFMGIMMNGFGGSGVATKGGYLIENIRFSGPQRPFSTDSFGLRLNQPLKWVWVRDCEVHGFKAGVAMGHASGSKCSYVFLQRVRFTGCGLSGIEGSADWLVTEDCEITDNGEGHSLTHGVYGGSSGDETTAITYRHNWIYDNNIVDGVCVGGNFTWRGQLRGSHIYYNKIENRGGRFTNVAWGISHRPGYDTAEYHLWTKIKGNLTRGFATHITVSSAPDVLIEGNTLHDNGSVAAGDPAMIGIGWPVTSLSAEDTTLDARARVRNNTIISDNPRTNTVGIQSAGGSPNSAGTGVVVDGNSFQYGAGGTSVYAMALGETNVSYSSISNNTLSGGSGWHASRTSLAAFQAYYAALPGTTCTGNTNV